MGSTSMASELVFMCARCGAADHHQSSCPKAFLRSFCSYCRRAGHSESECGLKRKAEAEKRKANDAAMLAGLSPECRAAVLAKRQADAERRMVEGTKVDDDAKSVASVSTASTATEARGPRLCEAEEKEARKHERALKDIAKLEERVARGEQLERTQLEKIQRRNEIEQTTVMQKIKLGFSRCPRVS